MPDPLSTAVSVVGIISLGIQVCEGLISYVHSVKDRKNDVADGFREAKTLISIFYSLHDLLPKIPPETSITSIQRCLKDSEEELSAMQKWLVNLRGSSDSTTFKGKMEEASCSVVYPFRQGKLDALRQTLQRLLDGLQMSVSVATLSVTVRSDDHLNKIEAAVEALEDASPQLARSIQELHDKLDSLRRRFSDTSRQFEERFDQLDWNVTLVRANTALTASSNERIVEELKRLSEGLEEFKRQTLSRPPQSQSSQLDSFTPLTNQLVRRGEVVSFETSCTCPAVNRNMSSTYLRLGGLVFQYDEEVRQKHQRGCKFYGIRQPTSRRLKAEMSLPMGWFLRRFLTASVDFAAGAGGLGVSVSLKNFVPQHLDPVYKFMEENLWTLYQTTSPEDAIQLLKATERGIFSIYREGRASPLDRDEQGRGHAEYFMLQTMQASLNLRFILSHDSVTYATIGLLRTLIEVSTYTLGRLSLAWDLIGLVNSREQPTTTRIENIQQIASYTCSIAEIAPESLLVSGYPHSHAFKHVISIFFNSRGDVHTIFRAIFSRSATDLIACIGRDPDSPIKKINDYTTLHLCADWPQGLEILLETSARTFLDLPCGRFGLTAVDMAIYLDCPQAVDVLMTSGCYFKFKIGGNIGVFVRASAECTSVVASKLAARRRSLLQLARGQLEPAPTIDPVDTLDTEAAKLCEAIKKSGTYILPHLSVDRNYTSIYHNRPIRLHQFPVFFDNGFRNLCAHNHQGLTPAMIWREPHTSLTTQLLSWLEEKDFFEQTPEDPLNMGFNKGSTGWHYLAAMGSLWITQNRVQYELWDDVRVIMHGLNRRPHLVRDKCICWCSTSISEHGCSPSSIFWKVQLDQWRTTKHRGLPIQFLWHHLFHYNIDTGPDSRLEPWVTAIDLIRLLTFEALEMRHTCCHVTWIYQGLEAFMNKQLVIAKCKRDRVQRIRSSEQEQQKAQELEMLMQEFSEQLEQIDSSPTALEGFIHGYWRRRIWDLYKENHDEVEAMKRTANQVRTCKS
ncbi:hypothetical protein QBC43DRAFT_349584, partial [Cladorrhinum sp. PSN259]